MHQSMIRILLSFWLLAGTGISTYAQGSATLLGTVVDSLSGDPLPFATVWVEPTLEGLNTALDGSFRLRLKAGTYTLHASYAGYRTWRQEVTLNRGDEHRVYIRLGITTLAVVEVEAAAQAHTATAQMGTALLNLETIALLPAFMGEVDLLKTLQLLPGVQAAGEGNAGFYVRGGGPDQNLILFDDAPVYNASHLLGFFSVFNSDAVESVELYKGGMPAWHGERLASVIDVKQRSGSKERYGVHGGIGLISSRLTAEGPMCKGASSFLISGRRTYIDALARPFINPESAFGGSRYYFYDFNARLDWQLKPGSSLYLSGYLGDDAFGFRSVQTEFNTDVDWGNRIVSAGLKRAWGSRILLHLNGAYTRYQFGFRGGQDEFELRVRSTITDYRLRPELSLRLRGHYLRMGLLYTFHDVRPNNSSAVQGETVFDLGRQQEIYSHEGAAWLAWETDLGDRWRLEAGLRRSAFAHVGPFARFVRDDNGRNQDTTTFARGARVATYGGWEPRAQVRYRLSADASIKASYTHNYQYIHLANISPLALPTDVWLPSTDVVQPQRGVQYALGYFRTFGESRHIEASIELYHKDMENLVEYRENAQPQDGVGNNEDNLLTFGRGYATGVELFLRKQKGNTTGWIGYTLSRTMRRFDDLNGGSWFPSNFDRRHDLALVAAHRLNNRWSLSTNFVYGTGRPITLPQSGYFIENRLVLQYADRNSFRMRDYHRLDLSATLHPSSRQRNPTPTADPGESPPESRRKVQSSWVFSIYNVYSRLNPYFYYFDNQGRPEDNTFAVRARQVSLFPILPSVTWNFTF